MISHNHYDHLDLLTIQALCKGFPKARFFVPLGNKSWLCSLGVPQEMICELDWWRSQEYRVEDFGHQTSQDASNDTILRFTCVPAQHNSGRGTSDQGQTLWCGWVIEQILVSKDAAKPSQPKIKGAVYHAGDTGYRRTAKDAAVCPIFKEIGQKFGPLDLSFVPIWRGGGLGFISHLGLRLSHTDMSSAMHAGPADAIDIHKDVMSRNTVAIHFGTFTGSENESLEAIIEFEEARVSGGVSRLGEQAVNERGRAGIVDIGESLVVEIKVHDAVSS